MASGDDTPERIELYYDVDAYLRVDDRIAYVGVYPGGAAAQWLRFRAHVQAILDSEMDIETYEPTEGDRAVSDFDDWMDEYYHDESLEPREDRPFLEQTWEGEELETTPLERTLRELMHKHPEHPDTIELASELTGVDYQEIADRLDVPESLDGPKEQDGRVMMALQAHI